MSVSIVVWLLLALVFFWAYGLNGRLQRMRMRSLDAMGTLEKHMQHLVVVLRAHIQHDDNELPARWVRLMDMVHTLEAELQEVRSVSLERASLSRLWRAFEGVQSAWGSVVKAPIDVAGIVVTDTLREEWEATTFKVLTVRGGINGILAQYNEALSQVPACWIARVLGHVSVGLME